MKLGERYMDLPVLSLQMFCNSKIISSKKLKKKICGIQLPDTAGNTDDARTC